MVLDKKQKLLIGLTLLLVAMLAYRLARPFEQQTVSKLTFGRTTKIISSSAKADSRSDSTLSAKINTDLMAPPPRLDPSVLRDPFRRPTPKVTARSPEPADRQPAPRIATPDERAREKLDRFKAFGSFRQGDRDALFLQRGKQVLVINVGDRIDGKFKIEAIDGRSVVVSAPDMPAPFQYEFEELTSDTAQPAARSTGLTVGGAPPGRRPAAALPPVDAPAPPPDFSESTAPETGEDPTSPTLPDPPPVKRPDPSFKSTGSPSRSYLPGTKPSETEPETE